jgi:hypothetical protein
MARVLDLRDDFADLYSYVFGRVRSFDPATNDGPGDPGPVTYMQFGYAFEQSGWAVLVFDTRPDGGPDGVWNFHIKGNSVDRPEWLAVYEANRYEPVRLVLIDGSDFVLPASGHRNDLGAILGELLKDVFLKSRADGVFASLPKAPECKFGIEELEGGYGWPHGEERWPDNLA